MPIDPTPPLVYEVIGKDLSTVIPVAGQPQAVTSEPGGGDGDSVPATRKVNGQALSADVSLAVVNAVAPDSGASITTVAFKDETILASQTGDYAALTIVLRGPTQARVGQVVKFRGTHNITAFTASVDGGGTSYSGAYVAGQTLEFICADLAGGGLSWIRADDARLLAEEIAARQAVNRVLGCLEVVADNTSGMAYDGRTQIQSFRVSIGVESTPFLVYSVYVPVTPAEGFTVEVHCRGEINSLNIWTDPGVVPVIMGVVGKRYHTYVCKYIGGRWWHTGVYVPTPDSYYLSLAGGAMSGPILGKASTTLIGGSGAGVEPSFQAYADFGFDAFIRFHIAALYAVNFGIRASDQALVIGGYSSTSVDRVVTEEVGKSWSINTTGNAGTATKLVTPRAITLTGDATGTVAAFDGTANASIAVTVSRINGVAPSALGTGILKNTTGTGTPSIATAGDFPTLNQNTTGSAAKWTTPRTVSLAGVVSGSVSLDGSANATLTASFAAGQSISGLTLNGATTVNDGLYFATAAVFRMGTAPVVEMVGTAAAVFRGAIDVGRVTFVADTGTTVALTAARRINSEIRASNASGSGSIQLENLDNLEVGMSWLLQATGGGTFEVATTTPTSGQAVTVTAIDAGKKTSGNKPLLITLTAKSGTGASATATVEVQGGVA
jgi:hypothetical protein